MKSKQTTNLLKVLIAFIVVLGIIGIAKAGYVFGGWLFAMLH